MEKTKCPICMTEIEPQDELCPQCKQALGLEPQNESWTDDEVMPKTETVGEHYDHLLELAKERAKKSSLIVNLCIIPFYAIPIFIAVAYVVDTSRPRRSVVYVLAAIGYFMIKGIWHLIHKKAMKHYTKVHYKEMINK